MSFVNPSPPSPTPLPAEGSDVASVAAYETAEEEYNEVITMGTQMSQDYIQSVGSAQNSVAQTATAIGQESMGASIAAATAKAKDVSDESQEVTQA